MLRLCVELVAVVLVAVLLLLLIDAREEWRFWRSEARVARTMLGTAVIHVETAIDRAESEGRANEVDPEREFVTHAKCFIETGLEAMSMNNANKGPSLDLDGNGDPVRRDRRDVPAPVVDHGKYTQNGPSCDLDDDGDPVRRTVRRRD